MLSPDHRRSFVQHLGKSEPQEVGAGEGVGSAQGEERGQEEGRLW